MSHTASDFKPPCPWRGSTGCPEEACMTGLLRGSLPDHIRAIGYPEKKEPLLDLSEEFSRQERLILAGLGLPAEYLGPPAVPDRLRDFVMERLRNYVTVSLHERLKDRVGTKLTEEGRTRVAEAIVETLTELKKLGIFARYEALCTVTCEEGVISVTVQKEQSPVGWDANGSEVEEYP